MKLRDILGEVKMNAIKYENDIDNKILDLNDQKVQLQAKLESLFDEQVAVELKGEKFDSKEIDSLTAEVVRLNGMITAFERQLNKGYLIPESDKQKMIEAAADEYTKDSIISIQGNMRLEEINEQLWKLLEEQESIRKTNRTNLHSEFEYSSLFNDEDIKDMVSRAEEKANILNNPEVIKLNKQAAEKPKSNYPYFWKKYYHSSEVRDLIYEAQQINK